MGQLITAEGIRPGMLLQVEYNIWDQNQGWSHGPVLVMGVDYPMARLYSLSFDSEGHLNLNQVPRFYLLDRKILTEQEEERYEKWMEKIPPWDLPSSAPAVGTWEWARQRMQEFYPDGTPKIVARPRDYCNGSFWQHRILDGTMQQRMLGDPNYSYEKWELAVVVAQDEEATDWFVVDQPKPEPKKGGFVLKFQMVGTISPSHPEGSMLPDNLNMGTFKSEYAAFEAIKKQHLKGNHSLYIIAWDENAVVK